MEENKYVKRANSFGAVVEKLKSGDTGEFKAYRDGWNGKGLYIKCQKPDEHSEMTLPYLYMEYPAYDAEKGLGSPIYPVGCRIPWLASQTDTLAEDWNVELTNHPTLE